MDLLYTGNGGVIDFVGAVYLDITRSSMTYRISGSNRLDGGWGN